MLINSPERSRADAVGSSIGRSDRVAWCGNAPGWLEPGSFVEPGSRVSSCGALHETREPGSAVPNLVRISSTTGGIGSGQAIAPVADDWAGQIAWSR
jgi:hypothetical protein